KVQQFDFFGESSFVNSDLVIRKGTRYKCIGLALDAYPLEEFMCRSISKRRGMPKNDELLRRHRATRRRAVVIEHLRESLPKQSKIILAEAGFPGEVCADESVATIETVRD